MRVVLRKFASAKNTNSHPIHLRPAEVSTFPAVLNCSEPVSPNGRKSEWHLTRVALFADNSNNGSGMERSHHLRITTPANAGDIPDLGAEAALLFITEFLGWQSFSGEHQQTLRYLRQWFEHQLFFPSRLALLNICERAEKKENSFVSPHSNPQRFLN